jgi:hypothetical protein
MIEAVNPINATGRPAAQQCPGLLKKRVSPHVLRHTCAMIARDMAAERCRAAVLPERCKICRFKRGFREQ